MFYENWISAEAHAQVAPYCHAIDINLGCPQPMARRHKYGAWLMNAYLILI